MTNNEAARVPAESFLSLLFPAVAFLLVIFAFSMPASACEVPSTASSSVTEATTVSYEFATDETAAGDLDIEYRDNYDYELDSPYCTVTPINGFEDVEAMLVQCEDVPVGEAPSA